MRLLLINKNPVVSRMMHMSVPKAGFEIEECDNVYDLPTGTYEVVVLDDEMYDENFLHDIKQNIKYRQIGIIASSKDADFADFDFVLTKPFLPTDLISILRKVKTEIEEMEEILPTSNDSLGNEDVFSSFLEEREESIVEIEELQEESPFVGEPLEKAGVLKEEEIEKVSSLLHTEDEKEQEPHELPEPTISLKEEPSPAFGFVQNEPRPEDILTQVHEEPVSLEENSDNEQKEEPTFEQEALPASTDMQTNVQNLDTLKRQIEKLDVKGLREILDGMQLEITIKISYPDK